MRSSVSVTAFLVVVCVVAVLVTTPALAFNASAFYLNGSSIATALPPVVSQVKAAVWQMLVPVAAKLSPYVPLPVRELVPPFLHGAVSLVMVGRGARLPPPSVNGAGGDELLLHTTTKFIYAAGAIAAELTLLRLVYREPYRNLRRNPMNRLFCSPAGFALLVFLTALPNNLVDTSLLCILLWKLAAPVYTPAIVCGQLLRVYAAALVPRLPPLSAAYAAALAYFGVAETPQQRRGANDTAIPPYDVVREAWAELALTAVVLAAVLFVVAAQRWRCSAQSCDSESDGDDYYK